MQDFEPIEVEFLINKNEVKSDAKKVRDEIKGIGDEAESTSQRVNKQINEIYKGKSTEIDRTTVSIGKQRRGVNELNYSIAQLTRELPAFTYSAQTGFVALSNNIPILADQISRLRWENTALVASGKKGVPIWGQLARGLFSWNTLLSIGVTLFTVYGKEIADFVLNLVRSKDAIDQNKKALEALNAAYDDTGYQKAIGNIIELRAKLELARQGIIDKESAVRSYNEIMGDAAGEVNTLAEAEQNVIDKAPAYIEVMLLKAAASNAQAEAAKKLAENAKEELNLADEIAETEKLLATLPRAAQDAAFQRGVNVNYRQDALTSEIESAKDRIEELKEESKKYGEDAGKIIEDFYTKAAKLAKDNGLKLFDAPDGDPKKLVDERKKLLEQIADLDKEYARKQLTRDTAEQQALKDKFDKVRQLVREFNADPKNSKVRISLDALNEVEQRATTDLIYKQDTRNLKEELQEQKKLFEEFEAYKEKFGTSAAKQRYAEQLGAFESYAEALKAVKDRNADAFEAVDNETATGGQVERAALIAKELDAATKKQLAAFAEQLAALQDYNTKRALLIEKYQALRKQLVEKGAASEIAQLDRMHQEELDAIDDANIKKTEAYKELFDNVGRLTIATGKKLIENAKKLLQTQNLSAETRAKILALIVDTEEKIRRMKADDIYQVASAISNLGASLQELDSPGLRDIGGLLGGLADGLQDVINISETESTGEAVSTAINSLIRLISVVTSAAQQRKRAEEDYYRSVIGLQQDYNLSLQDQIRLQSELSENVFIKDYEGRIKSALEAVRSANEGYTAALRDLEKAQAVTGTRNKVDFGAVGTAAGAGAAIGSIIPGLGTAIGAAVGAVVGGLIGLFGGKKKVPEFTALLHEYPDLIQKGEDGIVRMNERMAESLIAHDLVNEKTKGILENIIEWSQRLDEARVQIREVIEELSGGLGNELRNALVDAFVQGEDAALKMGDTVEGVLENIVGNLVFNRIFSDAFTRLEDDMAKSFDLGGDGSWVDDFGRFFSEAEGLTDSFNRALSDAQREASGFGFDIFKPDDTEDQGRGLAGAIRRDLTEETGSELTGLFRGQYDITKRHFELAERQYTLQQKHYDRTLTIMQHTALIEGNTRETVRQLEFAVLRLDDIKNNTKKGQTGRDLGFG